MKVYLQIVGLGALAGMRSMVTPWLVTGRFKSIIMPLLALLGVGELVADKLPGIPARIEPPALAWRAIMGAWVGSKLAAENNKSRVIGVLLGCAAAVTNAYAVYYLRRAIVENTDIPDFRVAITEDAIVLGGGWLLLRL